MAAHVLGGFPVAWLKGTNLNLVKEKLKILSISMVASQACVSDFLSPKALKRKAGRGMGGSGGRREAASKHAGRGRHQWLKKTEDLSPEGKTEKPSMMAISSIHEAVADRQTEN